ncbi:MAG: hypothetical protein ACRD26_20235 [Vicinamibacterales bacterium]
MRTLWLVTALVAVLASPALAQNDIKVLATNKTSTLEKEMNEAAEAGYRFATVMGGNTSFGGSEAVVIMTRLDDAKPAWAYRLLATNKTGTMQKELQEAGDAGYEYRGQTTFKSTFGGKEVVVLLERDTSVERPEKYEYKLLATKKTSTMQKELAEAGAAGYQFVGMTVSDTLMGGSEVVCILRRKPTT